MSDDRVRYIFTAPTAERDGAAFEALCRHVINTMADGIHDRVSVEDLGDTLRTLTRISGGRVDDLAAAAGVLPEDWRAACADRRVAPKLAASMLLLSLQLTGTFSMEDQTRHVRAPGHDPAAYGRCVLAVTRKHLAQVVEAYRDAVAAHAPGMAERAHDPDELAAFVGMDAPAWRAAAVGTMEDPNEVLFLVAYLAGEIEMYDPSPADDVDGPEVCG
jgi:hypothetical protein